MGTQLLRIRDMKASPHTTAVSHQWYQLSFQMHASSGETASTRHCSRAPDLKKTSLPSSLPFISTGIGSFVLSYFEKWFFFPLKRLNYFDRDLTAKDQLPQRSGSSLSLGASREHLGSWRREAKAINRLLVFPSGSNHWLISRTL